MSIATLAVPSKGRLRETALERLAEAGWDVDPPADARSYRATVKGRDDIEVAFLSASEIARELGAGRIDAGITGEDLVREGLADSEDRLDCAARLGFGHADVVVAVPEAWFDVETMADLGEVAAGFRARHGRRALGTQPHLRRGPGRAPPRRRGVRRQDSPPRRGSSRGCRRSSLCRMPPPR